MAKNELKKVDLKKLDIDTKVITNFALLEFCKIGTDSVSIADIDDLFQAVKKINDNIFTDDSGKAMEIASNYQLDDIDTNDEKQAKEELKSRIAFRKKEIAYKEMGYFALASGETVTPVQNAAGITSSYLARAKVKNPEDLAIKMTEGALNDEEFKTVADALARQKNTLVADLRNAYALYKDRGAKNPLIESVENDIKEYTFEKGKKKVIPFTKEKSDKAKEIREEFRDDFDEKPKPDFLELCGCLMSAGSNASEPHKKENFREFKKIIEESYGKDAIDLALNLKDSEKGDESSQYKAFCQKSEEFYYKSLAAILVEKSKYAKEKNGSLNRDEVKDVLDRTFKQYIKNLKQGSNNLAPLNFQEPIDERLLKHAKTEREKQRIIRRETARLQKVSVHHNIPVGAIWDVSEHLVADLGDERSKKAHCKRLLNNFSNFSLVIGKEKHESMEAKAQIVLGESSETKIMAARIDCEELRQVMRLLPKEVQDKINQYVKMGANDKVKDISVTMKFPEPIEIQQAREGLVAGKTDHVTLTQKIGRYYGTDKTK